MQGRRGRVGSLPEVLNFEHGSSPSSSISHYNRVGNGLTECLLPIPVYGEHSSLNGWEHGEASTSGSKNDVEQRHEHVSNARLEQQQNDNCNENHFFAQCSVPNHVSQNLNLNASFVNHGSDAGPSIEIPEFYKSAGVEVDQSSSRGLEYSLTEDTTRSGCKRKAIEAVVGQSSSGLGRSEMQRGQSSSWTSNPECYPVARGISISGPVEQIGPPIVGPNVFNGESSRRNVRSRINPLDQQGTLNPALLSTGSISRHPGVSSLQQNPGMVQANQPWDMIPGFAVDGVGSLNQTSGIHLQGWPRAVQPIRWNAAQSTNSCLSRDATPGDETGRRNMARNPVESPFILPAPQPRTAVRSVGSRSSTAMGVLPANVASGPVANSSTVLPTAPLPNPTYAHSGNTHAVHQRRFADLVRRSLLSTHGVEHGGIQNIDNPLLRPGIRNSMEGVAVSSGASNMGHHQSHPRAVSWLHRQGNVPGVPHPLRALAPTNGGRNRLIVSEIRNVLDLMRRGENLRIEDFMILDPSVFYGMADMHDRHRDMRLDVDNMSYEELLALEERIGDVCTGLSEETIKKHLNQRKYCVRALTSQDTEPCSICQEEYNEDEDLGILECGHDFHWDCVKQWLMRKNLCPICKTTGLNTTSATEAG